MHYWSLVWRILSITLLTCEMSTIVQFEHFLEMPLWDWNEYWPFQILENDAVKVLHSICQQIWKTQQWLQDWKRSVFIPIPKNSNAKECSNYHTTALISQASKVMLKILQARLQQYMNHELPGVQAGFKKGRGTRDQMSQHPLDHGKSKRVPEKLLFLLDWLCQSLWLCRSQ